MGEGLHLEEEEQVVVVAIVVGVAMEVKRQEHPMTTEGSSLRNNTGCLPSRRRSTESEAWRSSIASSAPHHHLPLKNNTENLLLKNTTGNLRLRNSIVD